MNLLDRILAPLEKLLVIVSGASLLLIMFLTTIDLLIRKFLDVSILGLYEFTEEYLMVAAVFLALSHVYAVGGHVRVTLFEHLVPPSLRAPWRYLQLALGLALFGLIAVKGWEAAIDAWRFDEVSMSALGYPMAPALMLVPIGSAMLCLRIIQGFFRGPPPDDVDASIGVD